MPPRWRIVPAERSSFTRPPEIGKAAVVPASVAGAITPGAMPRLVERRAARPDRARARWRCGPGRRPRRCASGRCAVPSRSPFLKARTPNVALSAEAAFCVRRARSPLTFVLKPDRLTARAGQLEQVDAAAAHARAQHDLAPDRHARGAQRQRAPARREAQSARVTDRPGRRAGVDAPAGDREAHAARAGAGAPDRSDGDAEAVERGGRAAVQLERGRAAGEVDCGRRARRGGERGDGGGRRAIRVRFMSCLLGVVWSGGYEASGSRGWSSRAPP